MTQESSGQIIQTSAIDWKALPVACLLLTVYFDVTMCGGHFFAIPLISLLTQTTQLCYRGAMYWLTHINLDLLYVYAATSYLFWAVQIYRKVATKLMLQDEPLNLRMQFRSSSFYATIFVLLLPLLLSSVYAAGRHSQTCKH